MTLSVLLYILALVFAIVACFVPSVWPPRVLAAAVVLVCIAGLLQTGGVRLE